MAKLRICLDPGHGGRDPGAVGPRGVEEKNITLPVAQEVATILAPVADVKLTRDDDRHFANTIGADLSARARIANEFKADCFVSIHCNSATAQSANGTETHCYPHSAKGRALAEKLQARLVPDLGLSNRGVKESNFAVLRETAMPAALVELAFISNHSESALLTDPTWQKKAARTIAQGIADFLGVRLQAPVPVEPAVDYKTLYEQEKKRADQLLDDVRKMEQVLGDVAIRTAPFVIKNR